MQKNPVSTYAVAAFSAAVFSATVSAETLAWYHLDEVAVGEQATTQTRYLNAVDESVSPGCAVTVTKGVGSTEDTSYFPRGRSGFPEGFGFFDPATGTTYQNPGAIECRTASGEYSGKASGVVIPHCDDFIANKMTIECFFRLDNTKEQTAWQYIFSKKVSTDEDGLSGINLVWLKSSKALVVVLDGYVDGESGKTLTNSEVKSSSLTFEEKTWHHVAVELDGETNTVKIYFDYAPVKTSSPLPFDVIPRSANPWVLGYGDGVNWGGGWYGGIDEFRISSGLLEPKSFLRLRSGTGAPILPETVVYQPFTSYGFFGAGTLMLNEAVGAGTLGEPSVYVYGAGYSACDDPPVPNATCGATRVPNLSALSLRASAPFEPGTYQKAAPCWHFDDPEATLSQDDLTVEYFFRDLTDEDDQIYLMSQDGFFHLTIKKAGLHVNWSSAASGNWIDGKWHHLAAVFKKSESKVYLYIDYRQVGWKGIEVSASENIQKYFCIGGYSPNHNETFWDADIDELRITRKALGPDDFIRPTDPEIAWDITCDASDVLASRFWDSAPDFSEMKNRSFDGSDKAGTQVADGPFAEPRANESSIAQDGGTSRSGGIILNDPEKSVVSGAFTVEFCFRFEDGYVPSSAEYMFFINNGFHIQFYGDTLYAQDGGWNDIGKARNPADGKWHHVAVIHDPEKGEFRAYFDYARLGSRSGTIDAATVGDKIYIGTDNWGQSCRTWKFDNVRVTRKALQPTEFVNVHPVTGDTLFWTSLDGADVPAETHLETPVLTSSGTFVRGNAGTVADSEGTLLRANGGSVSLASGALSYSRLSLLERKDQTVEFFLKAGAAADGADLVSLVGADASKPIWSLRHVDGTLQVVVTDGNGTVTEVVSAGALPVRWAHFAISFEPAADGSSTTVTVYRDHALFGASATFAGTLAVDGLSTSALKVAKFDGQLDELRVSKGTLPVADMLYGLRSGFFLLLR